LLLCVNQVPCLELKECAIVVYGSLVCNLHYTRKTTHD
jgi:hypothetical protein